MGGTEGGCESGERGTRAVWHGHGVRQDARRAVGGDERAGGRADTDAPEGEGHIAHVDVSACQNDDLVGLGTSGPPRLNLLDYGLDFGRLRLCLDDADRRVVERRGIRSGAPAAVACGGVDGIVVEERSQMTGVGDEFGTSAVVGVEVVDGGAGKVRGERGDILGRRAAEAVDGLVIVADSPDRVVWSAEKTEKASDGPTDILILVDEDPGVPLAVGITDDLVVREDARGLGDKVREVDTLALVLLVFVGLEELRERRRTYLVVTLGSVRRPLAESGADDGGSDRAVVRTDAVFGARDRFGDVRDGAKPVSCTSGCELEEREVLGLADQVADEGFASCLVEDPGVVTETYSVAVGSEDRPAEPVERLDVDGARDVCVEATFEAVADFLGGVVREREDEDALGRLAAVEQEGETADEGRRLARPGARPDEGGGAEVLRGLLLDGVVAASLLVVRDGTRGGLGIVGDGEVEEGLCELNADEAQAGAEGLGEPGDGLAGLPAPEHVSAGAYVLGREGSGLGLLAGVAMVARRPRGTVAVVGRALDGVGAAGRAPDAGVKFEVSTLVREDDSEIGAGERLVDVDDTLVRAEEGCAVFQEARVGRNDLEAFALEVGCQSFDESGLCDAVTATAFLSASAGGVEGSHRSGVIDEAEPGRAICWVCDAALVENLLWRGWRAKGTATGSREAPGVEAVTERVFGLVGGDAEGVVGSPGEFGVPARRDGPGVAADG